MASIKIKSISLKLIQILLFTTSLTIYFELTSNKYLHQDESSTESENRKHLQLYYWFIGIVLFSIAWSIGTFKWLSRFFLSLFIIKSIQQVIQHLPKEQYYLLRLKIVGLSSLLFGSFGYDTLPEIFEKYLPNTSSFSFDIISSQCLLILFFSTLGFNIYLADKFWLIKTIILDWIVSAILLIVCAVTDLLKKQHNLYLVISYIFGSNILGFITIRLLSFTWNLSSKIDDKLSTQSSQIQSQNNNSTTAPTTNSNLDDSIIYDTDSAFGEQQQQDISSSIISEVITTTSSTSSAPNLLTSNYISERVLIEENGEIKEQELQVDNLDYSKLNEDELNSILSEPIPESQVSTRNVEYHKSTRFINNLIAPENINYRISAKEFVGVIILWIYTISNILMENYSSFTAANILTVIGFSGTILAYLSTISAKRLTNKNPSKREC